MKKYILYIMSIFLSISALSSCIDDDYMQNDKGSNELKLSTSATDIILNEQTHSSDAVSLNWTTGNNFGTGKKITYTLELALSGTNFAKPYVAVDNEQMVYSWTKKMDELNTLLYKHFGAVADEKINFDARIIANVPGCDEVQTSDISFSVKAYKPVTSTLFLIGDATPNGWSADNASEMARKDNGIFTWSGKMKVGNYKFITTIGQSLPSYNKGDNGKVFLRTSDAEPDGQYTIEKSGFYAIEANLFTGIVKIMETEGNIPAYDKLFFVGNPSGWNFIEMKRDPIDPFLFRYGKFFETGKGGEFKFGTVSGNWENMYKALNNNASISDTKVQFVKGFDSDNKWVIKDDECNKAYKICVDIRDGKEKMMMKEFKPYSMLYLVGDATPAGWSVDNATEMKATTSPYVFTWKGSLNVGEMKISCDKKSDWNGAWFMPVKENMEPTGTTENLLFIDKSDENFKSQYPDFSITGVDQKWKIKSSGTYVITINQLEETISIIKQ